MDFLRNKEVKRQILISVALTAIWVLIGCLVGGLYALPAFGAGFSVSIIAIAFTYRRYRKIAELSVDIDRLLHGDETISFQKYQEGELYILQDELSKMTIRLLEQAQDLKKEKSYLADALANISHQLKTPLTSLNILNCSLSSESLSDEKRFELVQEQVMLLSRMEWLITTLLKISQFDAGAIKLECNEILVKDIVTLAIRPLEISAELKELTIEMDIPENAKVGVDLEWTAQAVGNILKNCIEHTPIGGKIEITAHIRPLYLLLRRDCVKKYSPF